MFALVSAKCLGAHYLLDTLRAIVLVNAYKCAKFQLPSSISFGDMKGIPK